LDNRHPGNRLSLVGLTLIIVVLAAAATGIWDRRKEAIQQARQEIANLDTVLAERTERSMQRADRVLLGICANIVAEGFDDPREFDRSIESSGVRRFMPTASTAEGQAGFIRLLAADGRLLDGPDTGQAPAGDFSNSDYFEYLRAHADPDAYVGAAAGSKPDGPRSFVLARRIDTRDGRLLGVAVVTVPLDPLRQLYQEMIQRLNGTIDVLRPDGTVIVHYPSRAAPDAGAERLVSRRTLDPFHMTIALSAPEANVLIDWRRHSAVIASGAIFVACVFVVLFRTLAQRSRSLERSEAELRESEARFRDFALTSSDWFWETDAQHRFVYQSEQIREFGQEPRHRLGRLRIDLATDAADEPEKWREHLAMLNRHEPFRDFVYERQVGADPRHFISVSGNPVFDPAGNFLGYRGTARNITARVLAERSLRAAKAAAEAANLAKSHFLANMTHELRTPLNAILGFAELLESGGAGPLQPRGYEYAGLIRQSGAHLLEVINELLDLARIDAGQLELHEEPGIDPRRLVALCVKLVERQADGAGLQIAVEITEPAPVIVADQARLTEILRNLLSNAIKFTEPGGKVSIAVRRTACGDVLFEVRDSGIGLTEAEIEIALEPFGQVDPGLSRQSTGAGLGLTLARRLAELHGGTLRIISEKGIGTTATLLLPARRVVGALALS
jgi:PAS domain S-box-containing protein